MRVTPSLPQRGRHPKGSIPLTPGFHLLFLGFFTTSLGSTTIRGCHMAGAGNSDILDFRRVPKIMNDDFYRRPPVN